MIERHMPDVKVVGVDRGGVGTKHRKCFFHGRDQSIKNITLNRPYAKMAAFILFFCSYLN